MSFEKPFEVLNQIANDYLAGKIDVVDVFRGIVTALQYCSEGYSKDVESIINLVDGGFRTHIHLDKPIDKDRLIVETQLPKGKKELVVAKFYHENKIDALINFIRNLTELVKKGELKIWNITAKISKNVRDGEESKYVTIDLKFNYKNLKGIEIKSNLYHQQNSYYTDITLHAWYPYNTFEKLREIENVRDFESKYLSYISEETQVKLSKFEYLTLNELPVLNAEDIVTLIKYSEENTVFLIYECMDFDVEKHIKLFAISTIDTIFTNSIYRVCNWLLFNIYGNINELIEKVKKIIDEKETLLPYVKYIEDELKNVDRIEKWLIVLNLYKLKELDIISSWF